MRRREGFTLIELLVVIAIIAVLAAILFPVFVTAKEQGRRAACFSNLKQLSTAFRLYADDHGGRMPESATDLSGFVMPDWCGCTIVFSPNVYPEKGSIWRYTNKSKKLYACGIDRGQRAMKIQGRPNNYPLSYAMNQHLRFKSIESSSAKATKLMLLIHQGRETIDNGDFAYNAAYDLPRSVHGNGTTLSYVDGHARWASYESLLTEADSWNPGPGH